MAIARGNLFSDDAAPPAGERFDQLAALAGARVERIVSSARPDGELYDQDHDEWVVLLRGEAELDVAGQRVHLQSGDWLMLPARTRHRVLSTSSGALWLAVHSSGTATAP